MNHRLPTFLTMLVAVVTACPADDVPSFDVDQPELSGTIARERQRVIQSLQVQLRRERELEQFRKNLVALGADPNRDPREIPLETEADWDDYERKVVEIRRIGNEIRDRFPDLSEDVRRYLLRAEERIARHRLDEIPVEPATDPDEKKAQERRLAEIARRYGETPSGREAAERLTALDPPPPIEDPVLRARFEARGREELESALRRVRTQRVERLHEIAAIFAGTKAGEAARAAAERADEEIERLLEERDARDARYQARARDVRAYWSRRYGR